MKDKTEAARLLIEAGWSFDEVAAVLGGEGSQPAPVVVPVTVPVPSAPAPRPYPYITPTVPDRWWNPWDTWSTLTINGVSTLTS